MEHTLGPGIEQRMSDDTANTARNTHWPLRLWVVRHGQSAGNVARDAAHAEGMLRIDLDLRDVDVQLSDLGERQAQALGRWFADGEGHDRPDVILTSTYVRARETARLFREAGGANPDEPICGDERLREKEFGILDGLTTAGILATEPQQAEFRRLLGKFYHRPPGGESWCDVIFRLRSLLDTVSLHYHGRRVMIVAHQVVVLCLRYVIENLTEEQKRNNHILSEQKRRNLIKQGFDDLHDLVPEIRNGGLSKSSVLTEAATFLETLIQDNIAFWQIAGGGEPGATRG